MPADLPIEAPSRRDNLAGVAGVAGPRPDRPPGLNASPPGVGRRNEPGAMSMNGTVMTREFHGEDPEPPGGTRPDFRRMDKLRSFVSPVQPDLTLIPRKMPNLPHDVKLAKRTRHALGETTPGRSDPRPNPSPIHARSPMSRTRRNRRNEPGARPSEPTQVDRPLPESIGARYRRIRRKSILTSPIEIGKIPRLNRGRCR